MKIRISQKPARSFVAIYPVFEKIMPSNAPLRKIFLQLKKNKEFEGKDGQVSYVWRAASSLPEKIVLVGLGDVKKITNSSVLASFGAAVKASMGHKAKTLQVVMPKELAAYAQYIGEAVVLANYQPAQPFKTGKELEKLDGQKIDEIVIVGSPRPSGAPFERGTLIAAASNIVRDWVNAPQNIAHVAFFEARAREIAKETGAKLTVLDRKDLTKLNMGALLGVNRGSSKEPRLIALDYNPKNATNSDKPIVLVGKGIVFDSGGYNLKPSGHIEDMQLDKSGAAVVLALVQLLSKLKIQRRVVCIAPLTDNVIGPDALKPADIVNTYAKKTVEITNTDGEGRLVLADAVAYAVDTYKPEFLIDIATLTGACMIALGCRYAGLFSNDEKLSEALRKAGEETDELLWPMPIHKDDAEKMKGQYADLRNSDTGTSRYAGASKGAAFIKEFIGKTKWAHLDIAGPAFTTDPKKYESKGATGFGLRVLVRFLEGL